MRDGARSVLVVDQGLAGFGERLLAVVDDGRRTATYKLALLLALIDVCAENPAQSGAAPYRVSTRTIARRVAELYWPQVRPYPRDDGAVVLRQITNKQATILHAVVSLATKLGPSTTFARAEMLDPAGFEAMIDQVELTVARYPLLRLQTVDGVPQPFIYDTDWTEGVSLVRLRKDGWVRFRAGAGDHLVRLAPLVRPLVELHWIRMVAAMNRLDLDEQHLREHLFGVERRAFPVELRLGLADMQRGRCFYCVEPLGARVDVDHFIPWARYPNDAIENLVLADPACNGHKRDRIPGSILLKRWGVRLRDQHDSLVAVASGADWLRDRSRSLGLARSVYSHLPDGTPLWGGPGEVEPADEKTLAAVLATIA